MKKGWLYGLVFGGIWIVFKMLAFALDFQRDQIQLFVLLNMALLIDIQILYIDRLV